MFKKEEKGQVMVLLIVIITVASFLLVGGVFPKKGKIALPDGKLVAENKEIASRQKSLQLDNLAFITLTPTPTKPPPPPQAPPQAPPLPPPPPAGNYCSHNGLKTPDCECEPGQSAPYKKLICTNPAACDPFDHYKNNGIPPKTPCEYTENKDSADGFHKYYNYEGCTEDPQTYCASKPIIYLYPTEKTIIDVRVETPGEIFISDPLYPIGGWRNVEAYPDGTLFYQGKKYRELYYESTFDDLNIPKNGIIIPKNKLREELKSITTKLGLNDFEQKEFIDYWTERLNDLNSPYILFSILNKEEKERVDHVQIQPEPDTRIEFLAYFKPLKTSADIDPLILPKEPPKRVGFTIVEWGGILDEK